MTLELASMGEWADGPCVLVAADPAEIDLLSELTQVPPEILQRVTTLDAALAAIAARRFACVLVSVPFDDRAGAAAVGEMRVLRQGPAIIAVGESDLEADALEQGASAFVSRGELDAGRIQREVEVATGLDARIERLVEHIVHQRRTVGALLEGVMLLAPTGRILEANDRAAQLLGFEREEFLLKELHVDDGRVTDKAGRSITREETAFGIALRTCQPVEGVLQRLRRGDGTSRWLDTSAAPLFRPGSTRPYAVVTCFRDVTEERETRTALENAEERLRLGFEHGAVGMAMIGLDGRIVEANPALCELLGEEPDQLVGTRIANWVHEDDREAPDSIRRRLFGGNADRYRTERRYVRRDGSIVWCLTSVSLIRDHEGSALYLFSQLQDITERKNNEAALEHQVLHDALTGLPNRLELQSRLSAALGRASASGRFIAVLFLDVDRFKLVNDGLGHAVGDRILVELARRLAAGVRAGDTVARFGGDEFIVVCEDVVGAAEADALGERTCALFDAPFVIDGKELYVSSSCGIVLVDGSASVEDALRDADAAMYEAKEQGRARCQRFDERLRFAVSQRFDIEQALRVALERHELRVVYQPILSLRTAKLVGAEALVRWDHPERGTLSPLEFIPAAEESGLITSIGKFVLEEALTRIVGWRKELPGCDRLWVSVNLSSRQLSLGDPVATCARALVLTGAEPQALRLELTESALMQDVDASVLMLEDLQSLGILIAIDDFGTGYSSLSYLSRLPVGSLKIDRSFIAGIADDPSAAEIARAIISLARSMAMQTCAEGVEGPEQLAALEELGCDLGQGYLWAPPLRPEDFVTFVREQGLRTGTAESTLVGRPDRPLGVRASTA